MKKPTPKTSSSKKNEYINLNNQTVNKVLDIGKDLVSAGNNLIELGKEKERTKQVQANANAQIHQAKELTQQTAIRAEVAVTGIHQEYHRDCLEHEREMFRLQTERDDTVASNQRSNRLLEKMLEDPLEKEKLAETFRALLPNKK